MALPPLASLDDLEAWFSSSVDPARAEAILSAASTLVRSTAGRAWVDAEGEPDDDLTETQIDAAHTVVLMVAARVYTNPNGVAQQTSGPFSKSVAAWAALGLELTDTEKGMLTVSVSGIPGLSSIRVVAPAAARATHLSEAWWWEDWDPDAVPGS